jgi:hypothetical protein
MVARQPKKSGKNFEDISHYFISAAEADGSKDADGAAGRQAHDDPPMLSDDSSTASPRRSLQPMRRKENCASCAHLIARAGQPFQCRIYSVDHSKYQVQFQASVPLHQGHTCPYFLRVTSKQIQDILRSHGSTLSPTEVRESAYQVEEKVIHEKTVTVEPCAGLTAEEALREELLRYLIDGYSIIDATVVLNETASATNHSSSTIHRIRLRTRQKDNGR